MPRLRRTDCGGPGITRKRSGRGFRYVDPLGQSVVDNDTRERIANLSIPPAWQEVWISPHPNGHLQATGIDGAGRKQYLYHEAWRAAKDREKFDTMLEFSAALPQLRAQTIKDLRRRSMDRERVLACAIRMLDLGFFRIGTENYAEENGTFGLATIRRAHVRVDRKAAHFDYPAKSGQQREQMIEDPDVVRVLRTLKTRRGGGAELLAFKDASGRWQDIKSADINTHLRNLVGDGFSAKDFRTWNGTVLAAVSIAGKRERARSAPARKRAIAEAVKEVAYFLGNTPAVARSSYIDPRVFDRFDSGWTIAARVSELGGPEAFTDAEGRVALEDAVRDLIEDRKAKSPALDKVRISRTRTRIDHPST